MKRMQKLGIFASLSFGIFAILIEVIRVYFLFTVEDSNDVTWVYTDSLLWSAVEMSIAITCACIPAMAPLLKNVRGAQRIRERTNWRWARLSSQVTEFKSWIRHTGSAHAREDNESLQEFVGP